MKSVLRGVWSVALVAMLVVVAAGFRTASAQDDANVRIIHASPDAPAVDIWVDGAVAIEGLEFGSATDYVPLPAGSYDVAVTASGDDIENAVIEATLDLEAGTYYEVAAIGFLADISAAVFTVDVADLADEQARVRILHLSPDTPAIDVAVADGPVLFENLEFPNESDAADVDAGTYDLEVRPTGTEDVALDLPGVAFEAGTVYDVAAIGSLEAGTLTVLPLTTATGAGGEDADADAAAGDDAAADEAASDSGTGGTTTTTPATGVGSTVESAGIYGWALLGAALLLALSGGYLVFQPARRK